MTADHAAATLDAELRRFPWYVSVGVGALADGPALFVYVKSERHRDLTRIAQGWQGYPIHIRRTDPIRALGSIKRQSSVPVAR